MSKRILTDNTGWNARRDAAPGEGTNLTLMRVYDRMALAFELYAVIIADDNRFEGL